MTFSPFRTFLGLAVDGGLGLMADLLANAESSCAELIFTDE